MGELMRFSNAVVSVFGLAACGFPRPADVEDPPGGGQDIDASSTPTPPSCIGLATTCGASGTDSCCNSPEVPGGTYYRSYDVAGDGFSGTASYPATVSNFYLDRYEVTVGRFRR